MALISVTILTGFLGSGKTTLLKYVLNADHGEKIAVIENEFGPENIDNEILVQDHNEQIVEMNNGCICCTVRGDLVKALNSLAERRLSGELAFDRVVIETTGLANPGPVAQTFFMDDTVAQHYLLDAVVTLVDAYHGMGQLDEHEEVQRQVGFADRLVLSKTDLISPETLNTLKKRLKSINPHAEMIASLRGEVDLKSVLDLRGFNLNDKLEFDPNFLGVEEHDHECNEHCADDHHSHQDHHHDDQIKAFSFVSNKPFDSAKLDEFLACMLQVYGPSMLRYKGVLWMKGAARKVVFQGVHQLMGSDLGAHWGGKEKKASKMVFIGKDLPKEIFISGLEACLV